MLGSKAKASSEYMPSDQDEAAHSLLDKSNSSFGTGIKAEIAAEKTKREDVVRFVTLVCGIVFFFGCHNYMQELIMSLPGFDVGIFLGYLEVLGVTICSAVERQIAGDTARRAPWSSYAALCAFLVVSSATSNIALKYINYPTKVVFRSCKLIPTMMIAVMYNKKIVPQYEFLLGGEWRFAACGCHMSSFSRLVRAHLPPLSIQVSFRLAWCVLPSQTSQCTPISTRWGYCLFVLASWQVRDLYYTQRPAVYGLWSAAFLLCAVCRVFHTNTCALRFSLL